MVGGKLLQFRAVSKEFGGTRALTSVSLYLRRGEVLALLGENGVGRSTPIKTLAGIYRPDGGDILFRGEPYHHRPPEPTERQPDAFMHQDLGLIEWMTVAENVGLAQGFSMRRSLIDWNATARRTRRGPDAGRLRFRSFHPRAEPDAHRKVAGRHRARSPSRPTCWCSTSRPLAFPPTARPS